MLTRKNDPAIEINVQTMLNTLSWKNCIINLSAQLAGLSRHTKLQTNLKKHVLYPGKVRYLNLTLKVDNNV